MINYHKVKVEPKKLYKVECDKSSFLKVVYDACPELFCDFNKKTTYPDVITELSNHDIECILYIPCNNIWGISSIKIEDEEVNVIPFKPNFFILESVEAWRNPVFYIRGADCCPRALHINVNGEQKKYNFKFSLDDFKNEEEVLQTIIEELDVQKSIEDAISGSDSKSLEKSIGNLKNSFEDWSTNPGED